MFPEKIRVSIGSAILLGLADGILDAEPTTIYLLTYYSGKCLANCGFCSQSRSSSSKTDLLSRVIWPIFPSIKVIKKIKQISSKISVKRICIQAMNYNEVFNDLIGLVSEIKLHTDLPISISCQPLNDEKIMMLTKVGIDRISIPLDASTADLFENVKGLLTNGPYKWIEHLKALETSVQILGKKRVSTHLIVGLGENDKELVRMIQKVVDMGVYPGLFAFTPIPGTRFERGAHPPLKRYRLIQLAHYLMTNNISRCEKMSFTSKGRITCLGVSEHQLNKIVRTGLPFMTSGCPNCNRPFFNERPRGPIYNYPRKLSAIEIVEVQKLIEQNLKNR